MIETVTGSTYTLFTASVILQAGLLVFIAVVLPESLRRSDSSGGRHSRESSFSKVSVANARHRFKVFIRALVSPISMLLPRPDTTGKMNYNVTLVGAGVFLYLLSIVRVPFSSPSMPSQRLPERIQHQIHLRKAHLRMDLETSEPDRSKVYSSHTNLAWVLHVSSVDHSGC